MHSENCPSMNFREGSEALSVHSTVNSSILEEDLALSSSINATTDKTNEDTTTKFVFYEPGPQKVVYLNEETMDCNYSETTETPKKVKNFNNANNDVSSPELFNSDDEDNTNTTSRPFRRILSQPLQPPIVTPREVTQEERITQSDSYLLHRINKFLTGVPPPPRLTICQNDCSDFLTYIKQNKNLFWVDPWKNDKAPSEDAAINNVQKTNDEVNIKYPSPRARSLRNLTNAFDACDNSSSSALAIKSEASSDDFSQSLNKLILNNTEPNMVESMTGSELSLSSTSTNTASISTEIELNYKDTKSVTFNEKPKRHLAIYQTASETEIESISWPAAYKHRAQGIYYNRNKYIEEFENLTLKLCARYIHNETQSTCTSWFVKQIPTSTKKKSLLGKSPGKRLSHLARRRRTFSSANLQGMAEKKQLVLNLKKPMIRKGKSPRGKSPRGKNSRGKSPRSSTKKKLCRRLLMNSPSPCKSKLETSKRALFQSPTNVRAGPSKLSQMPSLSDSQKIKRALFPTPSKKNDNINDEMKKRKCEEELEGPRSKKPKSLSFDCPYNLENNKDSWTEKNSAVTVIKRSESLSQPVKTELSEVNRKKLLWAVNEALRSKGITLTHPKFKQYAMELARTVRRCMPDLENKHAVKRPGSTSDRMLKLAKHYVLLINDGKCE
ncbi:uncharacterized protein mi [Chelonus insularis]|uniref:uncharacterized protein mi n=1 Tax=Chelonus insularis TaxID=460826 RepID=UPI00158B698E|nr:uncharacterized protein LOC118074587 [Chelonus insularis]